MYILHMSKYTHILYNIYLYVHIQGYRHAFGALQKICFHFDIPLNLKNIT